MFGLKRRRKDDGMEEVAASVLRLGALLENQQEVARDMLRLLKDVDADARRAKAECRVLSLIVTCLLAHVADEFSGRHTLDVVLGDAERIIDSIEAERGDAPDYRRIIREIREGAELRRPKPP